MVLFCIQNMCAIKQMLVFDEVAFEICCMIQFDGIDIVQVQKERVNYVISSQ